MESLVSMATGRRLLPAYPPPASAAWHFDSLSEPGCPLSPQRTPSPSPKRKLLFLPATPTLPAGPFCHCYKRPSLSLARSVRFYCFLWRNLVKEGLSRRAERRGPVSHGHEPAAALVYSASFLAVSFLIRPFFFHSNGLLFWLEIGYFVKR